MSSWTRRDYLKAMGALAPAVFTKKAFAQNESLADYLTRTGRDPSFAARKLLWTDFRPADKYTGSSDQNTAFLKTIKGFDAAPSIELIKTTVSQSEEVRVRVSGVRPIGIETGLGLQSISAQPGGNVTLGKVSQPGSYTIRVTDGDLDRRYLLFLLPMDAGYIVELYGATAKAVPAASPVFYQPEANVADALAKLHASLSAEAIQKALQGAIPAWLVDNAVALSETMVVCAVGGPVPCLVSGAANGWSAVSAILTKLAMNSPSLSNEEKDLLKNLFAIGDAAGQAAASFWGIPQRKKLCDMAGLGIVLADSVAGQIESGQVRVTLKVALQSTKKYTTLLCAKKL